MQVEAQLQSQAKKHEETVKELVATGTMTKETLEAELAAANAKAMTEAEAAAAAAASPPSPKRVSQPSSPTRPPSSPSAEVVALRGELAAVRAQLATAHAVSDTCVASLSSELRAADARAGVESRPLRSELQVSEHGAASSQ